MDLTYTMKNSVIPFWELTDWIFYINNNYPYRLEDFVKSFSENQMLSKTWLVERLKMDNEICAIPNKEVWILGSWYGTVLVPLLAKKIPNIRRMHLVDYDEDVLKVAKQMFGKYGVATHHYDVNFDYPKIQGDLIINTSCEHMWPMKDYDFGNAICAFQSNNFKDEAAHINCVDSLDEFVSQTGLSNISYKGENDFHRYDDRHKRYMVIGKK